MYITEEKTYIHRYTLACKYLHIDMIKLLINVKN